MGNFWIGYALYSNLVLVASLGYIALLWYLEKGDRKYYQNEMYRYRRQYDEKVFMLNKIADVMNRSARDG